MIRYSGALVAVLVLQSVAAATLFAIDPAKPGELKVYVAVAASPEFLTQWVTTTPNRPITIKPLRKMKLGETAYVGFIVTGWMPKQASPADVEVDCQIVNPDGTVLFNLPAYSRYRGQATGPSFVMADPALDFHVDPGDQVGTYHILVTVRDKRSGKMARADYALGVEE